MYNGYRNVLVSPLSLKITLALLYEGSQGATEKEIQTVLNFPEDKESLRTNYSKLLDMFYVRNTFV